MKDGDLLRLVVGQRLLQLRPLGGGPDVRGDAGFRLLCGQGGGEVELVDVGGLGVGKRDVEGLEGALHGGGPLSRVQVLVGPFLEVVGHVILAIWGMSQFRSYCSEKMEWLTLETDIMSGEYCES